MRPIVNRLSCYDASISFILFYRPQQLPKLPITKCIDAWPGGYIEANVDIPNIYNY